MDKLYYNFKDLPFQWIRPKLKIQDWGIDPNVGRITFRAHPLQFFTTASLRFLNSLDIHVDDFCILLLGIPAGMAVDIHTDYVSPSDFKGNLYKGYWSLNVPIGTENVYTTWFDGPIKENHVYREEEAGNILYEIGRAHV